MEQRRALGLSAHTAHTSSREDGRKHNGGKQPKKHVWMDDDDFVSGLIHSGIPLAELDQAFAANSYIAASTRCLQRTGMCPMSLVSSRFSSAARTLNTTSSSVSSPSTTVLASLELRPVRLRRFLSMRQSHALSWSLPLLTTSWRLRDQSIASSLSEGLITNAPCMRHT